MQDLPAQEAPNTQEEVTIDYPSLYLPIEDVDLIQTINSAMNEALAEKSKLGIDDRSKTNNNFWVGKQANEDALDKRYQMAHVDNVIYPDLENRIMLAVGRSPDIVLLPPSREQEKMEATQNLQAVIRERIDSNTIKRLLKDGLRNMHLDLLSAIVPRWNPQTKDYTFELVLSENLLFSKGSKVPHDGYTIDATDIVMHWIEEPVKVVMAKFPNKRKEFEEKFHQLNRDREKLPSTVRYLQVSFTWHGDNGDTSEGIAWKYGDLILEKMRQPYYDYDNPDNNFFDRPHKPYILFSYQNRGKSVYETTTAVEQSIPINRVVNKRLRQITEIADRSVPKLAFRGGAIKAEMAKNISSSPKEAIMITTETDDIRKEMSIIPSQPPNRILYEDLLSNRGRIDSLMATHGTTRGETQGESGVSKQISREGDLVTSDDLVDFVVERVVYEMVCWALQFMRLYYDDDRDAERIAQKDGDTQIIQLNRKTVEVNVRPVVKASSNDKQTRRADALQMLEAQTIDPYTLFEDLDLPNPKERLKRLLAFQRSSMAGDFTAYLATLGIEMEEGDEIAEKQRAQADIEALKSGQMPPNDQPPTDAYLAEFIRFVNSAEFEQLPPEVQQAFQAHIANMRQKLEEVEMGEGQPNLAATPANPQAGAIPPPEPSATPPQMNALQTRAQNA